jgi:hypothetical protein
VILHSNSLGLDLAFSTRLSITFFTCKTMLSVIRFMLHFPNYAVEIE